MAGSSLTAPCAGLTDLFFGPGYEAPRARADRIARASALCSGCPMRQECFNGALERGEEHGVWGGNQFPYDAEEIARQEERRMRREGQARDSAGITIQEAEAS